MNNFSEDKNLNLDNNKIIVKSKAKKSSNKVFIVGGIYFFSVLLFVVFKILSQLNIFHMFSNAVSETISSCIVQIFIMVLIPLALYFLFTKSSFKQTAKDFRFKKISAKSILFSFLIGFGIYFLVAYVSGFFSTLLAFFGAESVPTNQTIDYSQYTVPMFFLTVFLSAILPAFCEEFMHRGMLIGTLSKYGIVFAIVTSSLAFGFLHMNINQCFYAILIGLFLGYLCIYTKSIFPCMIIHFMNNFLNVFFDFCYVNDWIGGGYYGWQNYVGYYLGNEGVYLLGVILFVLALIMVVYFSFQLIKNERLNTEVENMSPELIEKYETLKAQTQMFSSLNLIREITKSRLSFLLHYSSKQAKLQSTTTLNYLEQPQGNLKFKWYDNIFLFSSIAISIIFCIISFISIVI